MAIYKSNYTGDQIDEGIELGFLTKPIYYEDIIQDGEVIEKYRDENILKQIKIYDNTNYVLFQWDGYSTLTEDQEMTFSAIQMSTSVREIFNLTIFPDWTVELNPVGAMGNVVTENNSSLTLNNITIGGSNNTSIKDSGLSINDLQVLKKQPRITLKYSDYDEDIGFIQDILEHCVTGAIVLIKYGGSQVYGIVSGEETQGNGILIQTAFEYAMGSTRMFAYEIDINPDVENILISGIKIALNTAVAKITSYLLNDYTNVQVYFY